MSKQITFNNYASYFEEAFPLGNSYFGCMYYGGAKSGKMSLNLDSMWSGNGRYKGKNDCAKYYPRLIELVKQGKKSDAANMLKEHFYGEDSEGYLPLGNLMVTQNKNSSISDYSRTLNIADGYALSSYTQDNAHITEKIFCSYADKVLVYKIFCDSSSLSRRIAFDSSFSSNVMYKGSLITFDGVCPNGCNPIKVTGSGSTIHYSGAIKVITDGKSVATNCINVTNASYIELRFYGNTGFYDKNVSPTKCAEYINSINKNFDTLYDAHKKDFSSLFNKSSVSIVGDEIADKTETLFNFGKYLLISSSRGNSMPANLQGIWSESLEPIWYCAYTMNINVEMNYWGTEKVNLGECMEPMYRFVSRLQKSGEYTAKEYFGAKGWCAFHNSDIWNMTTPVGATHDDDPSNYAWFLGTCGWLCHSVYQHYAYTLDKEYLSKTAFPIIEGAVLFYLDILELYNDEYVLIPGASPENAYIENDEVQKIAICSTIDSSIVYGLFKNYISSCDALNIQSETLNKVKAVMPKLPLPKVGSDGCIIEWDKSYKYPEETHRHISHLYFNFPEDLNKDGLYDDAIKKVFSNRGLGGTGWSIAWKINQFARLHDAKTAYQLIKRYLQPIMPSAALDYSNGGGTYPNYFCAHPPFQIDGNFGVMSAIAEMLLQDNNDYIELLPAVPDEWVSGEVNNLVAKGGYNVQYKWCDGVVTEYQVRHDKFDKCIVKVGSVVKEIKTNTQYIL